MSLALSIGGLVLFTGVFVYLAYVLLYFDKLDREAKLGCGCILAWFLFLLGAQVYYIALRLPELWEIRKLGLTLQEIHTAEQLADTRVYFLEGRQLLPRMEGAMDDPTDPVWAEAQQYIQQRLGAPTRFNRSVWGAFLEWGRALAREQAPSRQDVSDRVAMRAGLARLVAADDLPDKVSQFKPLWGRWSNRERLPTDSLSEGYADRLLIQMHFFYPNDDVAYLAMSDGLRPPGEKYTTAGSILRLLFLSEIVLLVGLLIQRCARLVTLTVLGRALLLYRSPEFLTFEREAVNPTRFVASFAAIGVITGPIAWFTIDPYYVLVYHREVDYLLAVLWNLLFGGILVECIGYVVGIAFLRVGINPMKTYVDNAIVSVLSVAVLWFFNNEWFVIVTSLMLGSAQNVLGKVMHRREAGPGQE